MPNEDVTKKLKKIIKDLNSLDLSDKSSLSWRKFIIEQLDFWLIYLSR